jgi:uncharacterized protein (TIGR03086 family)
VHATDAGAAGSTQNRGMSQPRRATTLDEELTRLIQSGRDREAAALAVDHLPQPSQGAPMDPRTQFETIGPLLNGLVGTLDDSQLDAPTPCAEFAVRDVLGHMIGGATMFAAAFRGNEPPAVPEGDVIAVFPVAMGELGAAIHSEGAMERTVQAPFGAVPGDSFARFVALDGLVHGWDIATATGQAYDPPEDLVAEIDAFARQAIAPGMRDGDTFAAEVTPPAGSSTLVRLVAFTGRQV